MSTAKAEPSFVEVDFDPFAGPEIDDTAPTTEGQREIWAAAQMGDAASAAYNESVSLTFEGPLEHEAFRSALSDLVQRHEALRSTVSADGLTLCIAAESTPHLTTHDFAARPERERRAALQALRAAEVEAPFQLELGPLFRVQLVRLGAEQHTAIFTAHHIVCDGWSIAVLLNDLAALYSARVKGVPANLPAAEPFTRYAREERVFERSAQFREDEAYWLSKLSGSLPTLDLPLDAVRPATRSYSSRREDHVLDAQLVQRLKKVGAQQGASFFTTLLAGFYALLSRISGDEDLIIGIPAAGQSATDMHGVVGHCVNTLPLRVQVDPSATVPAFLRQVRGVMLDGFDHQRCTFGSLLKKLPITRDRSRAPLMSVLFNVDRAIQGESLAFAGLKVHYEANPRAFENFEIFINAAESGGVVVLETQFNTDLFAQETIQRWLAAYEQLLRGIAEGTDVALGALTMLPSSERDKLLYTWNATFREYARDALVHDLFTQQAARTPDAIAVRFGEESMRYRELDQRSNQLAHELLARGVQPDQLVGLCHARSIELVVAMLGILKAGAAYVPLDPAFPSDRLAFMIEDAQLQLLVTETAQVQALGLSAPQLLCLDTAAAKIAEHRVQPPSAARPHASSRAYVIYTSGSTGKPKGVCVPHGAVVNFLLSMAQEPGLTSDDVLLAVTTLSFDIAVLELLLPLAVGASVLLASREMAVDGALLREAIERHGVTTMQATPSTWRLLLAAGFQGSPSFKALCGGEPLPRALAGELLAVTGSLWNMYGPTETTVWSTCHRVAESDARVLIGRPIANTTLYVLDERMQPVPVGVPGELHIGGDGVTLGYLGREALTRERFVPDPFAGSADARLYKTGDMVRFRADGCLEYLRRNDNQIKLRGYRIELGEIEARLAAVPGVAQAVVATREVQRGDVRLVGYVIASGADAPPDHELRAALRRELPEYMLPQHFVRLRSFPLTPNNKIDRKALPLPEVEASTEDVVAARDAREQRVLDVFQRVLGVGRMSVTANFFEQGGHSILAAQVLASLQREHGVKIPLRQMFDAPTAEALAKLLPAQADAEAQATEPRIPRLTGHEPAPLSSMQQRLWILEQLDPGLAVYNLPSSFRIRGRLDVAAFERAVHEIVRRHEPIRTVVREAAGVVEQVVLDAIPLPLTPVIDLRSVPSAQREAHLRGLLEVDAAKPFSLTDGPLVDGKLYQLADDEHVFFWNAHHVVWDGWSFDVFLHELDVIYGAFARDEPSPLPEPAIRYRDFAAWQRAQLAGPELKAQAEYWHRQLAGELPVLELPTDRPRPAQLSYRGATESFFIPEDEIRALTALGRRADATLYMVILTAFNVLLSRLSSQDDVIIGTPIRGRSQPETEDLIGFFVNTLVFRTDLRGAPSFLELLGRVRAVALDAYAHQDMPFDELVHALKVPRDLSRTPIFQAFFTYQDVSNRDASFGELPYSQIHVHAPVAPTDLYLWVKETGSGLTGGIDYATDLFDRETMQRLLRQLRQLLSSALKDPGQPVTHLNLLPDQERRAILAVNATDAPYPRELGLQDLVQAQCARTPDAVAVVCRGRSMTFAELDQRATKLAHHLRELGIARDALVGICVERSPEMLVAMLATLKAGGGYVPLDPSFPGDRLGYMIDDAKLGVIVTQGSLREDLPPHAARVVLVDELDSLPAATVAPDWESSRGEAVAYAIYTSGSTGKPKGVMVPQRAVVNFLHSIARSPGLGTSDVLLAVTTLSFDIAVLELWLPLMVGARIVLADRDEAADGDRLLSLIREHGVTMLQATPATFRLLLASGLQRGDLPTMLVGGEALPRELARELTERAGAVWNMYGPTETTVWSTSCALQAPIERVKIGRPLDNTQVYVVDRHGELCPLGVPGELWIGGDGVTRGYLGQPELTATRFVPDTFLGRGQLYRTGDIVRLLPDGDLEYQRRNDNQVKVRGYRIELGELELALESHPAIARAVAMVREDRPGDARLVVYMVKRDEATDSELRRHLRGSLPEYFLPQHFVELESFPLTLNGKVDRKALPPPDGAIDRDEPFAAPETANEQMLAAIWREALQVEEVSAHDNFFTLGGHSLLALQVIARIERETGQRIGPRVLLLNSLRQVASQLPGPADTGAQPSQPVASREGPAPAAESRKKSTLGSLLRQAKKVLRGR